MMFQKILIPSRFRKGLSNEEITDEFITDWLNYIRGLGEDISNGTIEMVDILETGDIEVYIEK